MSHLQSKGCVANYCNYCIVPIWKVRSCSSLGEVTLTGSSPVFTNKFTYVYSIHTYPSNQLLTGSLEVSRVPGGDSNGIPVPTSVSVRNQKQGMRTSWGCDFRLG